jgi:hypothetical protein
MWVPPAARAVCYSCGMKFTNPSEKNNCHLCFDVFCTRCIQSKRLLPVHYGYTDPQPVCNTCNLLLTSFVRFAAHVHRRGAGILLPPREAVIIASCNLPSTCLQGNDNVVALPSKQQEEGFFSRLFRRSRSEETSSARESSDKLPTSTSTSPPPVISSFCNIPQSVLGSRGVQVRDASSMFMVGWRPLNISTAIVVGPNGDVHLFLKDIIRVSVGGLAGSSNSSSNANKRMSVSPASAAQSSPSAAAAAKHRHTVMLTSSALSNNKGNDEPTFNDGRITVEMRGGYFCQLLVGQVEIVPRRAPSGGDEDSDDDEEEQIDDFTSDTAAAQQLADRLSTLIKHCKQHFALSQASLALHADLCPT